MVPATDSETLDPFSARPPGSSRAPGAVAAVEIFYHSDLSRIGERFDLCPAAEDSAGPVAIGREVPSFVRGQLARPLLDPCISRCQALVSWSARRMSFVVQPDVSARREIRLFDLAGRVLAAPSGDVFPGTLLAFGDRILLLLAVRPSVAGPDYGLVGASGEMAALRHRISVLAQVADTVLVLGQTGSGKELVCQALHSAGPRADRPFVALNCAALPESLIESELFGYVKGAFSGATTGKLGLFQAAGAGTLLLDEIGELPLTIQAKLLRVLEAHRVRPIGAHNEEPVAARVIAATHRDLREDVAAGRFRADLYARLEAPQLLVPPLRARRDDIPALFATFLRARADDHARASRPSVSENPFNALFRPADGFPPKLPMDHMLALLAHDWPRNVRELAKHTVTVGAALLERAPFPSPPAHRSPGQASDPPTPGGDPSTNGGTTPSPAHSGDPVRSRPTRAEVDSLLDQHGFNQADVARSLGVPYTTLDRWMRELGVVRPKDLTTEDIQTARRMAAGDLVQMARFLRVSLRGLRSRIGDE